jgi:Ca2+/Na+ antiporter
MFIGSWLINITISLLAFFLVFIGSLLTNTLPTSIIRSCLAFLFFYFFTYFLRWLWMLASKKVEIDLQQKVVERESEHGKGSGKKDYSKEDIEKVSKYVKGLINH